MKVKFRDRGNGEGRWRRGEGNERRGEGRDRRGGGRERRGEGRERKGKGRERGGEKGERASVPVCGDVGCDVWRGRFGGEVSLPGSYTILDIHKDQYQAHIL